MDTEQIRQVLTGLPVSELQVLETTTSTNAVALGWADAGAPDSALVVANEQTAGRGRLNRRWITRPGAALAFSLVLRPTAQEAAHAALFSALGGLAASAAIRQHFRLEAEIKWPNDVLINRRKVCGVLAEGQWIGDQLTSMVVGIGINITPAALPPADQVAFPATCLEDEAGRPVERTHVLAAVFSQIFYWRLKIGSSDFINAWETMLAYRGERVYLSAADGVFCTEGILLGVNPDGDLRISLDDGRTMSVSAGELTLRPI